MTWELDDCGQPDYLDGIKSQYMVYAGAEKRVPVGYFFRKEEALMATAAPDLLAACKALDAALCDGFDTQEQRFAGRKALIAARAAIAKAETV